MPEVSYLEFRKSSYSNPQNCVEVAQLPRGAALRDSTYPETGHFAVPGSEWAAFLDSVKNHEL